MGPRSSSLLKSINRKTYASHGSFNSLWFERLSLRLGLGRRLGIMVIGVIPVVLFSITAQYLSGGLNAESLTSFRFLNSIAYLTGYLVFIMLASRYICRRIDKLAEYSKSMLPDGQASLLPSFKSLYSMRGIAVTFGITLLIGIVWLSIVTAPADFFIPATRMTEQTSFGETMVNIIAVGYLRFIRRPFFGPSGIRCMSFTDWASSH